MIDCFSTNCEWNTRTPCSYNELFNANNRYQWLSHYALYSGGYREDALECMERLVQKYRKEEEEDDEDSDLS